jgi:hypothetical protein
MVDWVGFLSVLVVKVESSVAEVRDANEISAGGGYLLALSVWRYRSGKEGSQCRSLSIS